MCKQAQKENFFRLVAYNNSSDNVIRCEQQFYTDKFIVCYD